MTQSEKIVAALEKAGDHGVTNVTLNRIAYRYSARLHGLRKEGYQISTLYIAPGLFRYVLHSKPVNKVNIHNFDLKPSAIEYDKPVTK